MEDNTPKTLDDAITDRPPEVIGTIERKPGVVAIVIGHESPRLTDHGVATIRQAWGEHVIIISDRVRLDQLDEDQMRLAGWVRAAARTSSETGVSLPVRGSWCHNRLAWVDCDGNIQGGP